MESPSPPQERPPQDQPPLHPNKSRSVNPTLDHPLKSRAADPYVWIPASLWPRFGTTAKPDPKSKDISLHHYSFPTDTISSGISRSKATSRETSPSGPPPIFLGFGSFSLPATLACGWTKEELFRHYCPVLVEKSQGGPLGRWMYLLCGRKLLSMVLSGRCRHSEWAGDLWEALEVMIVTVRW